MGAQQIAPTVKLIDLITVGAVSQIDKQSEIGLYMQNYMTYLRNHTYIMFDVTDMVNIANIDPRCKHTPVLIRIKNSDNVNQYIMLDYIKNLSNGNFRHVYIGTVDITDADVTQTNVAPLFNDLFKMLHTEFNISRYFRALK